MEERHVVVLSRDGNRAIAMDSITHANAEYGPNDVLIGASFAGIVAVQQAAIFKPKGIIAHDAGIGLDGAGINGLGFLDGRGIPAAAVAANSAPLADGVTMWEKGRISVVNHWAHILGVRPGDDMRVAIEKMFSWNGLPWDDSVPRERRDVVKTTDKGSIVALDSIRFSLPEDRDNVVCVGSHGGTTAAAYALEIGLRGFISSDAGRGWKDSGISGLSLLEERQIPAAAVDVATARIGEGLSTYRDGVVSAVNGTAIQAGVEVGQRAIEAAELMLSRNMVY